MLLDAEVTGPPEVTRGELSAQLRLVPEASRRSPPMGSAPKEADVWATLYLTVVNRGSRVRDFDTIVAFPSARTLDVEPDTLPESLGTVRVVVAQPGATPLESAASRGLVRVFPGVEQTVLVKLVPPRFPATGVLEGFLGLFDASGSGDALRFPLRVKLERRYGRYEREIQEPMVVETLEAVTTCLDLFTITKSGAYRRDHPGRAPAPTPGPLRLVQIEEPRSERPRPAETPAAPRASASPPPSPKPPPPPPTVAREDCRRFIVDGAKVTYVRTSAVESCALSEDKAGSRALEPRQLLRLLGLDQSSKTATVADGKGATGSVPCSCVDPM